MTMGQIVLTRQPEFMKSIENINNIVFPRQNDKTITTCEIINEIQKMMKEDYIKSCIQDNYNQIINPSNRMPMIKREELI